MARQSYFAMLVLVFSLLSGFAQAQANAPININEADAVTLAQLDGIGESKARAIIAYREANGPFQSVSDLTNVKGIGEKTVANNETRMNLE